MSSGSGRWRIAAPGAMRYVVAMTELLGLRYSPWSEKARWALEARHVPFRFVSYAPLVGEPGLRWKLARWRGTVSVPVLTLDDGDVIVDSADIARWADLHGDGPTLFPVAHAAAMATYIASSEQALAAGRARSLLRVLDDDDALLEMVPRGIARAIGRAASVRIGAIGIRRTLRKYRAGSDASAHERTLVGILDQLREALAASPASTTPATLFGSFSFADIAMAQALAFVSPPSFGLRIGPASRRSFTDAAISARYVDLVAWRDALYDAHRPRNPPPSSSSTRSPITTSG